MTVSSYLPACLHTHTCLHCHHPTAPYPFAHTPLPMQAATWPCLLFSPDARDLEDWRGLEDPSWFFSLQGWGFLSLLSKRKELSLLLSAQSFTMLSGRTVTGGTVDLSDRGRMEEEEKHPKTPNHMLFLTKHFGMLALFPFYKLGAWQLWTLLFACMYMFLWWMGICLQCSCVLAAACFPLPLTYDLLNKGRHCIIPSPTLKLLFLFPTQTGGRLGAAGHGMAAGLP